jgi:acetyl esterase/lipase
MCDFSEYGHPSMEWLAVGDTLHPAIPDQSLDELKRISNSGREASARTQMEAYKSSVAMQDISIVARDGYVLEARCYRNSSDPAEKLLPIYIHFHGGGFLFGTLSSEDAICSRLAINTRSVVVNVNYRHTPEAVYPTAWDDSEDAIQWICSNAHFFHGNTQQVVVGGISAGAWLVASFMRSLCDPEENIDLRGAVVRGQVLMIPCLVHQTCYQSIQTQIQEPNLSSYVQCQNAPILPMTRRKLFSDLLKIPTSHTQDKRLNPGLITEKEARNLRPTTLGIAGNDTLRDEGLLYGKLLAEQR